MLACICIAQFCYICGVPWKNCPCERWEEDQFYGCINIADKDIREGGVYMARRENLLECELKNLLQNHE